MHEAERQQLVRALTASTAEAAEAAAALPPAASAQALPTYSVRPQTLGLTPVARVRSSCTRGPPHSMRHILRHIRPRLVAALAPS